MGAIIDEMIRLGIPVIAEKSNEEAGLFYYGNLNWDQLALINKIRFGFLINLEVDSPVIVGDGLDSVLLTVNGRPSSEIELTIKIGDSTMQMPLILDAHGFCVEEFVCETSPTKIEFHLENKSKLVRVV